MRRFCLYLKFSTLIISLLFVSITIKVSLAKAEQISDASSRCPTDEELNQLFESTNAELALDNPIKIKFLGLKLQLQQIDQMIVKLTECAERVIEKANEAAENSDIKEEVGRLEELIRLHDICHSLISLRNTLIETLIRLKPEYESKMSDPGLPDYARTLEDEDRDGDGRPDSYWERDPDPVKRPRPNTSLGDFAIDVFLSN